MALGANNHAEVAEPNVGVRQVDLRPARIVHRQDSGVPQIYLPYADGVVALDVTVGRSPVDPDAASLSLDVTSAQALSDSTQLVGLAAAGAVDGGGTAPLTLVWRAIGDPVLDHGLAL